MDAPLTHVQHFMRYFDPRHDTTGMLKAVADNNLRGIKYLVGQGVSVNLHDRSGYTPLHVAVAEDSEEIVSFLLACDDIKPNTRNIRSITPLYIAIEKRDRNMVELLLKGGAEVNAPNYDTGDTPLHAATRCPEIGELLIEHGAMVNAVNTNNGRTPLHETVWRVSPEAAMMLLNYEPEVNVRTPFCDDTPFMMALRYKVEELQKILIRYVKDFNEITQDDCTVFELALMNYSPHIKEMIERGADINHQSTEFNCFNLCIKYPSTENFKLIWRTFRYQRLDRLDNYMYVLADVPIEQFREYVEFILKSQNFQPLVISLRDHNNYMNKFLNRCKESDLPLEYLHLLMYELFVRGYLIINTLMDTIYRHYGCCELFQDLLHLKIDNRNDNLVAPGISRLIYDPKFSVPAFMDRVIEILDELEVYRYTFDYRFCGTIFKFLAYPRLVHKIKSKCYTRFTYQGNLPDVPKLLDVARNAFRDAVVERFGLWSCWNYIQYLEDVDLPEVFRNLLIFKTELYDVKLVPTEKNEDDEYDVDDDDDDDLDDDDEASVAAYGSWLKNA